MCINIDLKEGIAHAADIAHMVVNNGMRSRIVYAANGAGIDAINLILSIDSEARFIDTKDNFTFETLKNIDGYQAKCYVYTGDFSDRNILEIRESRCMLATTGVNAANAEQAFRHRPDMIEYPHTSDFSQIDNVILNKFIFK